MKEINNTNMVKVIGAGLAGSEAVYQLSRFGINCTLFEMRTESRTTHAHNGDRFAEMVCSNSFRSDELTNAVGLLHEEMRIIGSLIMSCADKNKVPAGAALAVDRELFAEDVTSKIESDKNIVIKREEYSELKSDAGSGAHVIVATGPLTSDLLSQSIIDFTGEEQLAFFDAIAPIVYKDSIDFSKAWYQSRYDKGEGKDYINCPMDSEQYYQFIDDLNSAEKIEFKEWEKDTPYFNGCLPIEVMAARGRDTLRYGPMKPVGLTNPNQPDKKPYAVVQLRQDNKSGTLYNIVGFQTKMKYPDQKRVLTKIPGLENAEFARLGGLHRNTFIKSPMLLAEDLGMKDHPTIKFAGQITGVEGYLESAAIGMLAGIFKACEILGHKIAPPPKTTALGALLCHITSDANAETFQPMNVNFGLFEDLPEGSKKRGKDKKLEYVDRGLRDIKIWYKKYLEEILS